MIRRDTSSALDALIASLFDYAGMFPPASLSFDDALRESLSFAEALQRPWMVGADLVLDMEHTRLLADKADSFPLGFGRPVRVCLLASAPLDKVAEFAEEARARISSLLSLVSIEAKVSPETGPEAVALLGRFCATSGALLALEPDLSVRDWELSLAAAARTASAAAFPVAIKCRCTGPAAIGPERLARAIAVAADARLPFKVTGGFHHPVVEPGIHEYPMGFLNLAAAVLLRRALGERAAERQLARLLANDSIGEIGLADDLSFGELSISAAQARSARDMAHFSVGSCSISEPDRDLLRLLR